MTIHFPPFFVVHSPSTSPCGRIPSMQYLCRAGLSALAALGALSCQPRTAIWIIPGSTVTALEFGISDARESSKGIRFGYLRINPCEGRDYGPTGATWFLSEISVRSSYVNRVRYGVAPLGYQTEQGPDTLRPGCYRATISGSHVDFLVQVDGTIVETSSHALAVVSTLSIPPRLPNLRLKLSGRGGRLVGNGSLLIAAAPARSLSAIR